MRPYLTIITDSFRAAFASRVLWFVLAGIMLVLLALAPLGYREEFRVGFDADDINSAERLTALLAEGLTNPKPTAARNVAQALPEDVQQSIRDAAETGTDIPRRSRYADAFNTLLQDAPWYADKLWDPLRFGELSELEAMDADSMNNLLLQRRNRLRLEAAFPGAFRARPERMTQIRYAGLDVPEMEFPVRRKDFIDRMNTYVLPVILSNLFGIGAVFIAVLVTAPIIPEMLQPGSLHLLLSKPLSRSALYLSKFVGGCAFVLLCETLLITGLWLIAGFRFDIWNHRLFYCIPVFVFLFAVYYSVSALAALRWRSAIVSVVITFAFWVGCFIIGFAGGLFDGLVRDPARVRNLTSAEGEVFTANDGGELQWLKPDVAAYQTLVASSFGRPSRILGPLRMRNGRVVAAQATGNSFAPFAADDASLMVLGADHARQPQMGLKLPRGTTELFALESGILAATTSGLWYAAEADLLVDPDAEAQRDKPASSGGLFAGITQLLKGDAEEFSDVLPSGVSISTPSDVAILEPTGNLAIYSAGVLYWLTKDNPSAESSVPSWSLAARVSVEGDHSLAGVVAMTSDHVVLARPDQPLRVYRAGDLQPLGEIPLDEDQAVQDLISSPEGDSVLAVTADRSAWRLERADPLAIHPAPYPEQGDIEALGWGSDGQLWIAHDLDRLTAVDPTSGEVLVHRTPERDLWRTLDAFVMTPLRTITPQTGEVSETVVALVGGNASVGMDIPGQTRRIQLDIVRPLATCAGFTFAMLLLGCVYICRQDF